MKIILLLILLVFAGAIVMVVLRRLLDTVQQLGTLRSDLSRNSEALESQMQNLQRAKAEQDAREAVQKQAAQERIIEGEVVPNDINQTQTPDRSKEI